VTQNYSPSRRVAFIEEHDALPITRVTRNYSPVRVESMIEEVREAPARVLTTRNYSPARQVTRVFEEIREAPERVVTSRDYSPSRTYNTVLATNSRVSQIYSPSRITKYQTNLRYPEKNSHSQLEPVFINTATKVLPGQYISSGRHFSPQKSYRTVVYDEAPHSNTVQSHVVEDVVDNFDYLSRSGHYLHGRSPVVFESSPPRYLHTETDDFTVTTFF